MLTRKPLVPPPSVVKSQAARAPRPINHKLMLGLALGAFVIVFVLWQIDSVILYPFRLMVTYVHEMGHGLAAILSGGKFESFHVLGNGAGAAFTDGGNRHLILPAGYLGTALFGAVLLYACNRIKRVRWVAMACGIFFTVTALLFAGTGTWNEVAAFTSFFAMFVGVIIGMVFMAVGWLGSPMVNVFVLNLLAFTVGFNALSDLIFLMNYQTASLGDVPNDAAAMAKLTNMPTMAWIIIWLMAAVLMVGIAAIMSFVEPQPKTTAVVPVANPFVLSDPSDDEPRFR